MATEFDETLSDYYDSDYPRVSAAPPSNWDEACLGAGVASDVAWYARVARSAGPRVLDVGAGTGRLACALAVTGTLVSAVEPSVAMRSRLTLALARLPAASRRRVRSFGAITRVPRAPKHDAATMMFSVLTSVCDLDAQLTMLSDVHARLRRGGLLALDIPNPLRVGAVTARPSWIRHHAVRGTRYVRVAGVTAPDTGQRVRIYGSYEEQGAPPRPFSIDQRMIFPGELRLMLERAGFELVALGGDVHGASIDTGSRLFVVARKRGRARDVDPAWLPAPPSGVAATALITAAARARHLEQAARPVVVDPYALRLAGAAGMAFLSELGGAELVGPIVMRTQWFDLQIERAVAAGARALLSLGAGLCTRAFRLDALRGVQVVEIDGADVLRYKEAMLSDQVRPSGLSAHPLDLRDAPAAHEVGALMSRLRGPVIVIAEGLFPYLEPAQAELLLAVIRARLSPGSSLFLDASHPDAQPPARLVQALSTRGIDWHPPPASLAAAVEWPLSATATHVGAVDASFGLGRCDVMTTLLHTIRHDATSRGGAADPVVS